MPDDEGNAAGERWAEWRAQTPVLRDYVYLNTGFSGPLRTAINEAMLRRMNLELHHGATSRIALEDRFELAQGYRAAMGRLFGGVSPDEVAITGNTSEGINIVVNGLGVGAGDSVVTTSVEHGSGMVPAYYQRERSGCDVQIVPIGAQDSPGETMESFAATLDQARGQLKLVILSEISYSTGQLLPLQSIVEETHRRGGFVLVDGAQTAGHIPIDVRASGADFYAVPSHKWLCGPGGLGALYVREELIPQVAPWKVAGRSAASYDFEGGFEPEHDRITKYELTTVSGPLIEGALEATEWFLDSGPQAVFERACELGRYAERRFERIAGVTVASPRHEATRTGLFCFTVDGLDAGLVNSYLQQRAKVVCRSVAQFDSVRLSLHAFNSEADVDVVAATVEQAIAEGIPEETEPAIPARLFSGRGA